MKNRDCCAVCCQGTLHPRRPKCLRSCFSRRPLRTQTSISLQPTCPLCHGCPFDPHRAPVPISSSHLACLPRRSFCPGPLPPVQKDLRKKRTGILIIRLFHRAYSRSDYRELVIDFSVFHQHSQQRKVRKGFMRQRGKGR